MNNLIFIRELRRWSMAHIRWISLLIASFFIIGCTGNVVKAPPEYREEGPDPTAYFCVNDDCAKQLEALLRSSTQSIHCAFYDLDLPNIISALGEKSTTVDVKIILDDEPYQHALSGPGVLVESKPSSRMHNKFCVVDSMYVWTGSFNPTHNDNAINENNGILMSSYYLSKNYEAEFSEMWNGEFSGGRGVQYPVFYHNGMKVENLFCPEDGCEERVVSLVLGAQKSIDSMVFSFTSERIGDALLLNTAAKTRALFDVSQAGSDYSQYHRLLGFDMDVRKEKGKGKLHHKVFIIDNRTVVTGSYNPTASGNLRNDENVLILHDEWVAKEFAEEFNRLWKLSE
jgi:phosphatidylserine/phosphatidylglycerophosphate/cardiolipin synthase-like enzyme